MTTATRKPFNPDRQWCSVKWWRERGIDAKWTKTTSGKPMMLVEYGGQYHLLSRTAWDVINERLDAGATLVDAMWSAYAFIDLFSVPATERDIQA